MYSAFISCLSRLQFFFDKVYFTKNYFHCLHVLFCISSKSHLCISSVSHFQFLYQKWRAQSFHHTWEEWAPCYFPSWRGTTRLLCPGSLLQGQGAVTRCKCLPALPPVIPEALLYVISLRNNCLGSTLKFNIDTVIWVPGGLGVNT